MRWATCAVTRTGWRMVAASWRTWPPLAPRSPAASSDLALQVLRSVPRQRFDLVVGAGCGAGSAALAINGEHHLLRAIRDGAQDPVATDCGFARLKREPGG